jgi:hypothetical protein
MALAQPDDPYIDTSGKVIQPIKPPSNARKVHSATVATIPLAMHYQSKVRRSIKELFSEPKTQTVINAVLMYSLLGMSPLEIAHILDTAVSDVEQIINLPAYQETFEALFREIISANSTSLQARISAYAATAIDNVFDLADAGTENENVPAIVVLKANQDILDRSGLAADSLFGKNAQEDGQNSLQIVITEAVDSKTTININTKR